MIDPSENQGPKGILSSLLAEFHGHQLQSAFLTIHLPVMHFHGIQSWKIFEVQLLYVFCVTHHSMEVTWNAIQKEWLDSGIP